MSKRLMLFSVIAVALSVLLMDYRELYIQSARPVDLETFARDADGGSIVSSDWLNTEQRFVYAAKIPGQGWIYRKASPQFSVEDRVYNKLRDMELIPSRYVHHFQSSKSDTEAKRRFAVMLNGLRVATGEYEFGGMPAERKIRLEIQSAPWLTRLGLANETQLRIHGQDCEVRLHEWISSQIGRSVYQKFDYAKGADDEKMVSSRAWVFRNRDGFSEKQERVDLSELHKQLRILCRKMEQPGDTQDRVGSIVTDIENPKWRGLEANIEIFPNSDDHFLTLRVGFLKLRVQFEVNESRSI